MRELHAAENEEESFFVSMTDMVVGVLFIFIILLMYFAFQARDKAEKADEIVNLEKSAEETRTEILEEISSQLQRAGIQVILEPENGILRLPESILFAKSKAELSPEGEKSVSALAQALSVALHCHAFHPGVPAPADCQKGDHIVETIFVEGHTDSDPFGGKQYDNWDLSVARASNTYRVLVRDQPLLQDLRNAASGGSPLFSVSGYADSRPTRFTPPNIDLPAGAKARPTTQTEVEELQRRLDVMRGQVPTDEYRRSEVLLGQYMAAAKAANRRIDLRILMKRPGVADIQQKIDEAALSP